MRKIETLLVVVEVGWAEVVRLSRRLCNAPCEEMREGLAYMASHTASGGGRTINGGWEYEKTLAHIIDDTRQCGEWVGLPEQTVHSLEWVSTGTGAHIFAIRQESGWLMLAISDRQSQYLNFVGGIRGAEFYTAADVVDEGEGSFSIESDARWPMPYHADLCDLLCQVVDNYAATSREEARAAETSLWAGKKLYQVVGADHWDGDTYYTTLRAPRGWDIKGLFEQWVSDNPEVGKSFWKEDFVNFLSSQEGVEVMDTHLYDATISLHDCPECEEKITVEEQSSSS